MYTKHDCRDGELITKSLTEIIWKKELKMLNNRVYDFTDPQGENGQSAYELWKSKSGNEEKSEEEFLASLKGEKG